MKYAQSWQDFMREPANKALKESKGIHACKQKFIQEQNKMQWYDPIPLMENGDAGMSVPSAAGGAGGGSVSFITGHTAEASTFTWGNSTLNVFTDSGSIRSDGATGSLEARIIVHAIKGGGTDFSFGHADIRKKIGLFFTSGSTMPGLLGETDLSSYDVVVTASVKEATVLPGGVGGLSNGAWTGSLNNLMARNIANQPAGATVIGFTNTIAPSELITAATGSAPYNTLVITNVKKGGVADSSFSVLRVGTTADTGSIATTTQGKDTYANEIGAQIFDAQDAPYSSFPFDASIS